MRAEARPLGAAISHLLRSPMLGLKLAAWTKEYVAAAENVAMDLGIARPTAATATRKYMVTVLGTPHAVRFRCLYALQVIGDAASAIRLLRNAQNAMGQSARFSGRQLTRTTTGVQSRQEEDFRS